MHIGGIFLLKRQSEHVFKVEKNYTPEIAAEGVRLAIKSKICPERCLDTQYVYKGSISDDEVIKIARGISKENIKYRIDRRYTRDELIPLLNSKSSAKKSELLEKAVREENIPLFKADIIEKFCTNFEKLGGSVYKVARKEVGEDVLLVVGYSFSSAQYWVVSNSWCSEIKELSFDASQTRFVPPDMVFINTKNLNGLLSALEEIEKRNVEYLRLKPCSLRCDISSFNEKAYGAEIRYSNNIEEIMARFDVPRKASKFGTFWEGLQKKSDESFVKAHLGKKIILSSKPIFIGEIKHSDFFETLASHMKLEYSQGDSLVARVVENETDETFTAVWNWIEKEQDFFVSLIQFSK